MDSALRLCPRKKYMRMAKASSNALISDIYSQISSHSRRFGFGFTYWRGWFPLEFHDDWDVHSTLSPRLQQLELEFLRLLFAYPQELLPQGFEVR
jgi:hypothetical protein